MTERELKRILAGWQKRLQLGHVRLRVEFGTVEGGEAKILVHDHYDEATVTFDHQWTTWSKARANLVCAHELLHVYENGIALCFEGLESVLENSAYAVLDKRYDHEAEVLVDRLAHILYEIAGPA